MRRSSAGIPQRGRPPGWPRRAGPGPVPGPGIPRHAGPPRAAPPGVRSGILSPSGPVGARQGRAGAPDSGTSDGSRADVSGRSRLRAGQLPVGRDAVPRLASIEIAQFAGGLSLHLCQPSQSLGWLGLEESSSLSECELSEMVSRP